MIVVLTPNPAIDMTYDVPTVRVGETHAVARVRERAGGKGVNTAAVLTAMDTPCLALCPTGEEDLSTFAGDLDSRGVQHALLAVPGRVRRSVAAVGPDGTATVFNEPGSPWPVEVITEGVARTLRSAAADATAPPVLSICGSIPPGRDDAVLGIVQDAQRAGARCVLDLRGETLARALPLRPDLVKPNRSEAAETLGLDPADPPPAAELAALLVEAGAHAAAVSDGSQGVTLVAEDGSRVHARLREPLQGNATGAGDALTAALAPHVAQDRTDWAAALTDGVAYSAAAVLQPVAGEVARADVERLRAAVGLA